MTPAVRAALEEALGVTVQGHHPLAGGDINEAYRVRLAGAPPVFVKTRAGAPPDFFAREAEGLGWLADADALRVPEVLAVGDGATPFLALEYLESGRRVSDFDSRLGRGLAHLHRFGAETFGGPTPNFVGSLPQDNAPAPTWPEFYGQRRLWAQAERAHQARHLPAADLHPIETLIQRLPDLLGPPEPPARLHGDLWGGNLHVDAAGDPCLIDPAVYGGHREVDLAMMRLFGGFGPRVFEAYETVWPLAGGWRERVALYQLYPLLVHVNLFGGGYVGQVRAVLRRYA